MDYILKDHDFFRVMKRSGKNGVTEIYPVFVVKRPKDLMTRGSDFYAIWLEDKHMWSTVEQDAIDLIDMELDKAAEEEKQRADGPIRVLHLWNSSNRMIANWHQYCKADMRQYYSPLDEKLIFANTETTRKDYASKRLPYPLAPTTTDAYERIISTLYSPEERHKIEWAIGSILSGDAKHIQKFIVLYGSAGTGKSTILNIIQQLFEGYYTVFDARALGSANASFALEPFRSNPLVAIQHDGDLSHIEDNTRLNSLVSHEDIIINEKFKSAYTMQIKAFLFMGTNKPVKITDGKSGLIRRLIDVSPTGNKIPQAEYTKLMKQIPFELGGIATHCLEVYNENPNAYDSYIPVSMMGASNDFYNFVQEYYITFVNEDSVTLKVAWELYKDYITEARVPYPLSKMIFKEELKNYFREYHERTYRDGNRVRYLYEGFRTEKFEESKKEEKPKEEPKLLEFRDDIPSKFDEMCKDCPAQYASEKGTPLKKWENVETKLSDISTNELHYVKVPENHIVIDFDIPGEDGNKSFEKNLEAASKWPTTYAELSKSGAGIHLHYIYAGDPSELSRVYSDHIEIKVFNGNSSLRRKFSKCTASVISIIASGLPLKKKGDKKMVNMGQLKSERGLRNMLDRCMTKEFHPSTRQSIDFIKKILDDAYESDLKYDVSDMRNDVMIFAMCSTNQKDYCVHLVSDMKFKSREDLTCDISEERVEKPIVFYDVEVFPNLFIVCWKIRGSGSVIRMINPTAEDIEELIRHYRLVGFNCRDYDNHILQARMLGYNNENIYRLSKSIIDGNSNVKFGQAYNISYTDVYDFASKKQSLKKWEIELGIHHQELGLPWDEPVPEEMWEKVASYCDNDVIATEAVFEHLQADFTARMILADLSGCTVNDKTNTHTTKIIFGNNKKPQSHFEYRNMGDESDIHHNVLTAGRFTLNYPEYCVFNKNGKPIFPGYKHENGKSYYRGIEFGKGGYVEALEGMHILIALLDIASMHPSTIIAENLFGDYTKNFKDLVDIRIAIKHGDFDKAREFMDGKLAKYLGDEKTAKTLAQALKIAINSVYGLTYTAFENPFRDPRNFDNFVANRGQLFMINLAHEVKARGFTVAHIKTDSIKIPNATPEIIEFVTEYGKLYGYNFEHEATYDRMCLVNKTVYIAKYDEAHGGEWTATGTQFQVPYVFKKLFSKESIEFKDLCETKSVGSALYLDNNYDLADVSGIEKSLGKWRKKWIVAGTYLPDAPVEEEQAMLDDISKGHNYQFIGKVGLFCPMKDCGGLLMRDQNGKMYAVEDTTGYRWMEAETVKVMGMEDQIDLSYFDAKVNEAVEAISQYGDFEWFAA